MRIAYISYEHPLGISGGGIGTYIGQISALMAKRGHDVEVFSGTLSGNSSMILLNGYTLVLIPAKNNAEFRLQVVAAFTERQMVSSFDIIESPEFGADGLEVKKAFPTIPLLLKLHTPTFLVSQLNSYKNGLMHKLRFIAGGLLKLNLVNFYWRYNKKNDLEYELYKLAESVSSPSVSLSKIVSQKWKLEKAIQVVPYPFETSNYPVGSKTNNSDAGIRITFIGKLEKRKGILDLMKAIPFILELFPDTRFRFVGASSPSPQKNMDMMAYMKDKMMKYQHSLEFLGFQPYHRIAPLIDESDICIFPSLWENFPNVCLEAMAAGCVVIATNNGGMADMIKNQANGILIPPNSPKSIFKAVKTLRKDPGLRDVLGKAAQQTIQHAYNGNFIGKLTEDLYLKTISVNG